MSRGIPLAQIVSKEEQRAATTLIVAGWGLCGCDFVEVKGMQAEMVFNAMPSLLCDRSDLVDSMQVAWCRDLQPDPSTFNLMASKIRKLTETCGNHMRGTRRVRNETITRLLNVDERLIRRACWLASYWSGVEHKEKLELFGFDIDL